MIIMINIIIYQYYHIYKSFTLLCMKASAYFEIFLYRLVDFLLPHMLKTRKHDTTNEYGIKYLLRY